MLRQVLVHHMGDVVTAKIARHTILVLFANGLLGEFDSASGLEQPHRVDLNQALPSRMNIQHAAVANSGDVIAVAADDYLRIFSTQTGDELAQYKVQEGMKARYVAWSKDDTLVAAGCVKSCRVFTYDPAPQFEGGVVASRPSLAMMTKITKPHSDDVVIVAISPNNQYLATGCKDRHVRVFRLHHVDDLRPTYDEPCERVYALDWSPNGY